MMNHPGSGDDNAPHKSTSWTSKLTKSLKRHSRKSSADEKYTAREGSLEAERSSPLHQNFAATSIPRGTEHVTPRGVSMDQDRSRMDNTGNWPLPTTPIKSSAQDVGRGHAHGVSEQQNLTTNSVSTRVMEDEFSGLDIKGRARRRSNDPADRAFSGDSHVGSGSSIKRKSVPPSGIIDSLPYTTESTQSRSAPQISNEIGRVNQASGLPISSQFLSKDIRTGQSEAGDPTMALKKPKGLLASDSDRPTKSDVAGLESGMSGLKLKGVDPLESTIPSAAEIIDRAEYNSAETITHERVAPGMSY